jgi:hypothetical protein
MADRARDDAPDGRPSFGYPGQYDENGTDLSLIRANMKLTPTERARRAEQFRRSILRLVRFGSDARRQSA